MILPGDDAASGGTVLTERERLRLGATLRHVLSEYGEYLSESKFLILHGCVISEAAYLAASLLYPPKDKGEG